MIRVRLGASSAKDHAPAAYPLGPLARQTMWSSGTCSWVVASQLRCDQKTCAFQLDFSSEGRSTFSTFFMKEEKSSYWVHWLYATRSGTPTSIVSMMLVNLAFLP